MVFMSHAQGDEVNSNNLLLNSLFSILSPLPLILSFLFCDRFSFIPSPLLSVHFVSSSRYSFSRFQAFGQKVTARQPEYDHVLAEGQNLLQLAHPRAVPVLQSKLQQQERTWVDLRGKVGEPYESLWFVYVPILMVVTLVL